MDSRLRRWVLPLLAASLAFIAVYVTAWITTPAPSLLRADFLNAYMGGQILRDGHGALLYDLPLQTRIYGALTAPYRYSLLAFYDTPSAAALAAPFTIFPVIAAWRVFSLVQLALLVSAAVVAALHAPWPARTPALIKVAVVAAGLAAFSTDVVFLQGQWSGLSALGIALGYWQLRRGNQAWAAFWLLAPILAVKPNLALALLAFVVGWGGRRMLGGLAGAIAVVLAGSLLVGGPSLLGAFLQADVGSRTLWPMASMDSITGITGSVFGGGNGADALGFAACVMVAAVAAPLGRIARSAGRLEPALAAAVALSLLASPHLFLHDLAMLTPAMVWFLAWAYARDHREARAIPRRVIVATVAWLAFNLAAGVDPHAASWHPVAWFLLAACIVLAASAGLFARFPIRWRLLGLLPVGSRASSAELPVAGSAPR
jgi:hypothetical protein